MNNYKPSVDERVVRTKHKQKKYGPSYVLKVYKLALAGLSKNKIAQALGIEFRTYMKWKRKYPEFFDAIAEGRADRKAQGKDDFKDYVYNQLPEHLQDLWSEIDNMHKESSGVARIEALLKQAGKGARQQLFLYALVHNCFNPSVASTFVNVSWHEMNQWCQADPDFQALVDQIQVHKKNFFEGALVKLVKEGDVSATIFVNKTFNKDRGYSEKIIIEDESARPTIMVDDLDLPLEVRKEILAAMRRKQNPTVKVIENKPDVVDAEFEVKESSNGKPKHETSK